MLPLRDWPLLSLAWAWLTLGVIGGGIGLLALGLLAVALFPRRIQVAADAVAAQPLVCLGLGCLVYVVALGLSPLLLCALPLVWGALALAGLFGLAAVGRWVGELVLGLFDVRGVGALRTALAGLLTIWLVAMVPLLGWAAFMAAVAAGLGATITTRVGARAWSWRREHSVSVPAAGAGAANGPPGEPAPGEQ